MEKVGLTEYGEANSKLQAWPYTAYSEAQALQDMRTGTILKASFSRSVLFTWICGKRDKAHNRSSMFPRATWSTHRCWLQIPYRHTQQSSMCRGWVASASWVYRRCWQLVDRIPNFQPILEVLRNLQSTFTFSGHAIPRFSHEVAKIGYCSRSWTLLFQREQCSFWHAIWYLASAKGGGNSQHCPEAELKGSQEDILYQQSICKQYWFSMICKHLQVNPWRIVSEFCLKSSAQNSVSSVHGLKCAWTDCDLIEIADQWGADLDCETSEATCKARDKLQINAIASKLIWSRLCMLMELGLGRDK